MLVIPLTLENVKHQGRVRGNCTALTETVSSYLAIRYITARRTFEKLKHFGNRYSLKSESCIPETEES